jgi:chemotaxis protein CheD
MKALNHAATVPQPDPVAGFEHMPWNWDAALACWSARILPGEYCIARAGAAIGTVLGSCISACIRDPRIGIGGMNHFMLPEDTTGGDSVWLDAKAGLATRYGSFAMESLLNGLLRLGARRERLEVKLFGGGRILQAMTDVGERNIAFARSWLAAEGLEVVASDVGETMPRRVVYIPATSMTSHGAGNDAELF